MTDLSKRCLVDVDDTVLVCRDFLEDFISQELNIKPQSTAFDIRDAYNIDDELSHKLIHDFWRSDLLKNLPPKICAAEVLPRLYAQGWRFVAITACADEPLIKQARTDNLNNAFGFEWEEVICTGYHSVTPDGLNKKSEYLSKFSPTIWVEDSFPNAVAGALLGHKTFLLDRDQNKNFHHDLVTRVQNWYDIENILGKI